MFDKITSLVSSAYHGLIYWMVPDVSIFSNWAGSKFFLYCMDHRENALIKILCQHLSYFIPNSVFPHPHLVDSTTMDSKALELASLTQCEPQEDGKTSACDTFIAQYYPRLMSVNDPIITPILEQFLQANASIYITHSDLFYTCRSVACALDSVVSMKIQNLQAQSSKISSMISGDDGEKASDIFNIGMIAHEMIHAGMYHFNGKCTPYQPGDLRAQTAYQKAIADQIQANWRLLDMPEDDTLTDWERGIAILEKTEDWLEDKDGWSLQEYCDFFNIRTFARAFDDSDYKQSNLEAEIIARFVEAGISTHLCNQVSGTTLSPYRAFEEIARYAENYLLPMMADDAADVSSGV